MAAATRIFHSRAVAVLPNVADGALLIQHFSAVMSVVPPLSER